MDQSIGMVPIYVLDNGSEEKDVQTLEQFCAHYPQIRFFKNQENLGFAKGCNFLIEKVVEEQPKATFVVLLNNDTIPQKDWLAQLWKTQQKKKWDMVSSKQVFHTYPDTIDNLGLQLLTTSEILPVAAREDSDHYRWDEENLCPSAGAGLYSLAIFEEVGFFNPYFNNCFEDAELGLRARLAGFSSGYSAKAIVKHRVSYSVKRTKRPDYGIDLQKNMLYAYFTQVPWWMASLVFPLVLLRSFALAFLGLVTFRFKLFETQVLGWTRFLVDFLKSKRTSIKVRLSKRALLRLHRSFVKVYLKYLKHFIFNPKPTVLE